MSLPVKITLLLGVMVSLVVAAHSAFLYSQIDQSFRRQADTQMMLCTALLQNRIDFLKQNLQTEMNQLSSAFFSENEAILANLLAEPPVFNTEVIHFAETLRKRTTLSSLVVLSLDGTVLSSSDSPASYGKSDSFPGFPENHTRYLSDGNGARIELKLRAQFGSRILLLRGGYDLQNVLESFTFPGLTIQIHRQGQSNAFSKEPGEFSRSATFKDYKNAPLLLVTVSFSPKALLEQREEVIRNSVILLVLSLMACLILGHVLSRWISHPLAQLTDAALLMSVGQMDVRVPRDAGGEVGELVTAFNRMAEQLQEKQEQLARTERIAAWEEIARHLAHEIKNPLTPIRTSIANLRLALERAPEKFPEIFLESSGSVLEEVEKLRRLADEFSRFARLPAPQLRTGNLNELIRQCLVLYRDQSVVEIEFVPGDVPEFAFDSGQISEVVHNLLRNAMDAMPSGGKVRVLTSLRKIDSKREVVLRVEDTGPGMPDEIRKQVFQPYFTTKVKGMGLGLAIVQRIVAEHHGSIEVESTQGSGTRFEIRLARIEDGGTPQNSSMLG